MRPRPTRRLRGARSLVGVAPLLALALLAGCGKYGPPRRVSPDRDAQAAVGAGPRADAELAGSEADACEDPEARAQP